MLVFALVWKCVNSSVFKVKYPLIFTLVFGVWIWSIIFWWFYLIQCIIWVSNLWVKFGLIMWPLYFAMVFLKFSVTKNLCTCSNCVLKTHDYDFVPFSYYFTWVLFWTWLESIIRLFWSISLVSSYFFSMNRTSKRLCYAGTKS